MSPNSTEKKYVLAIDQGTTSSRAILFNHDGEIVAVDQKEHKQIFPRAGWVEHDANEIWDNIRFVVSGVLAKAQINRHEIASVGITNQRESAVVWAVCMVVDAAMASVQVARFIGVRPDLGEVALPVVGVLVCVGAPRARWRSWRGATAWWASRRGARPGRWASSRCAGRGARRCAWWVWGPSPARGGAANRAFTKLQHISVSRT